MRFCFREMLSVLVVLAGIFICGAVFAQDNPSGALDFGLGYSGSSGGHHGLNVFGRAMAVDRVPDTMVGRFAELYLSLGVGLEGEFVSYSAGAKFGVGFGTRYFVLFLASGLMVDAYQSVKKTFDSHEVKPGLGLPLVLGLWVDAASWLYLYAMAEPSWSFWGKGRKTKPFIPFNFAWELRLRGGAGFSVGGLNMRVDYQYHQVNPHDWHSVCFGIGF